MPELPEVETVKNNLKKFVLNRTVKDIKFIRGNIVQDDHLLFKNSLMGASIKDISRFGKFLIFHFDNNMVVVSHLRMEGKFIFEKDYKNVTPFARVIFYFTDGSALDYDDSRMFGIMCLKNKDNYLTTPPLSELGKEANTDLDINEIYPIIHKDKRTIKEVLLDQHILSGIGNIYADETLYKSHINPFSDTNLLTKNEIETILKNAKDILNKSIEFNGSTVHTYTFDAGKSGNFQQFLECYSHNGEPCLNCKTPLVKIFLKGRGTTYCPKCQKIKKSQYLLGITGPTASGKSTILNYFKNLGFLIYSADERVSELYKNNEFIELLFSKFKVRDKNGIRELIKKDSRIINSINSLIHPIIKKDITKYIKEHKTKNIAFEIPLLFECELDKLMNETLFIYSNRSDEFIKERGSNGQLQKKINQNINYRYAMSQSTFVINNSSTIDDLYKELDLIFKNRYIK